MKIQTLKYFIALAESRSINEAAQKLYVAQPSLTKALQLFESEVGLQLFVRSKNGIDLTQAGSKILPEAKQMVAYYDGWLEMPGEGSLHTVDIYIHSSFPNFLLPDIVLQFKKTYPDIRVNCVETTAPEQYISQDTERPVLALFICGPQEPLQRFTAAQGNAPLVLLQGEYGCLANKNSGLTQKSEVTLEDLKEFYLVLPEFKKSLVSSPSFITPVLNDIIAVVSPRHTIQVESVASVIELVRSHPEAYALSYYPALNRYEGVASKELIFLPFHGRANTKGDFCLFFSKKAYNQYPALQYLIKSIHDAADTFLAEASQESPRRYRRTAGRSAEPGSVGGAVAARASR